MASSEPIIIDNTSDPAPSLVWRASDWIGQNKVYPCDPPQCVLDARQALLDIPLEFSDLIPSETLPVMSFLGFHLPDQPSVVVTYRIADSYSKLPPNETLRSILARPIPPPAFITELNSAVGQAWFDGCQSVDDKRYKGSRLPLHVVTYWREVSLAREKQQLWQRAMDWVDAQEGEETTESVAWVRKVLLALPWTGSLRISNAIGNITNLCILLSFQWFDDSILDLLMAHLSNIFASDPHLSDSVMATGLAFARTLAAASRRTDVAKKLTESIRTRVDKHGLERIYFFANVSNLHWVPLLIDFRSNTLSYGKPRGTITSVSSIYSQ